MNIDWQLKPEGLEDHNLGHRPKKTSIPKTQNPTLN